MGEKGGEEGGREKEVEEVGEEGKPTHSFPINNTQYVSRHATRREHTHLASTQDLPIHMPQSLAPH